MCNKQQAQPFKSLLLHFQAALKHVVEGEQGVQKLAVVQCGRARRCTVLQDISTVADQLTHNEQKPAGSKDASKGAITDDGYLTLFSAVHKAFEPPHKETLEQLTAKAGQSEPWICLCCNVDSF